MFNSENLQEKWQPVLEHPDLPGIQDNYKRAVTSVILENQEKALKESAAFLGEDAPVGNTSVASNWDPILISLVRRAMPNLIAYDICSVQPMTGPTGLIFAMKSRFNSKGGDEALFDEAVTTFSGAGTQQGTNPAVLNDGSPGNFSTGTGDTTANMEAQGDSASNAFAQMAFTIEKGTVEAKTRALKAEYTK